MHEAVQGGGGYEVLAVRYGTRTATKAETYLNHHVYGEPDESFAMDYFFWLVRGHGRTVLVDCGFGAEAGRRRGRTTLVDPVEALSALVTPLQVLPPMVPAFRIWGPPTMSTASPSTLMYFWMMGSRVMWLKLVREPMRMFSSSSRETPRILSMP